MAGGASAADKGRDLKGQAAAARAARKSGDKVKRGQSETAFKKQAKAWDAGAVGEGRSQRQLDRLRTEGFTSLHDVLLDPAKKWNLDHVVVGPNGVLFVDAKNWRGKVTVYKGGLYKHWYAGPKQGRKSENMTREINKIAGMAKQASERLGFPVQPVLCLVGVKSRDFEGPQVIRGVTVIGVGDLVAWVRAQERRLSPVQVKKLAAYAKHKFPPATEPEPLPEWVQRMRDGV